MTLKMVNSYFLGQNNELQLVHRATSVKLDLVQFRMTNARLALTTFTVKGC